MDYLLSTAEMRAREQAAIDSGSVSGLTLMERAGAAVRDAILDEWPRLANGPHHAVVLCGPGNNGGDGFVVARLLQRRGWSVDVWFYGDETRLPPDARENYRQWRRIGQIHSIAHAPSGSIVPEGCDLVVDAFFGIGLRRPVEMPLEAMIGRPATAAETGAARPHRVAIDIPSGLDADSGRRLGAAYFLADLTVTFHAPKIGHMLADGPATCGNLVVKPIGLGNVADQQPRVVTASPEWICRMVAKPAGDAHKYSYGHALVLGGASGHGGAARLAARGALRIGAGLVTLACPPLALPENAAQMNAVMVRPLEGAVALTRMLEHSRITSLCLGPGLGRNEATRELVSVALTSQRKCVLDADALSAFEKEPETLFQQLHSGCVLTPHMGEFRRLFPEISARLSAPARKGPAYSRLDATHDAAAHAGCTVLLKGPDTVIADERGGRALNAAHYGRAAPWLATAGSGDVLAGFIAGLLARGSAAFDAATAGTWLHVECARAFGPGLIAEDLAPALPGVFRALGTP